MTIKALDDGELDTVGLVEEVENAFGIKLADDEVERVMTVGQLHRLVVRKTEIEASGSCLTTAAFFRVRAALTEETGVQRSSVRPSTTLESLLGRPGRQRWERLTARLGSARHPLTRSSTTRKWMFGISLYAGLAAAIWGSATSLDAAGVLCEGVAGMALTWLLAIAVTWPLRCHPPFATVGDLARAVVAADFPARTRQTWSPGECQVWDKLTGIIAKSYGVRPNELLPDTRFVGDMEMGDRALKWLGAS